MSSNLTRSARFLKPNHLAYHLELVQTGVQFRSNVKLTRHGAEVRGGQALWDSTVREALHEAAEAEGCDFLELGAHSCRRANIIWRQEVGGSAIAASRIAGNRSLEMTSDYTFVAPELQNELTRRIQEKLAAAGKQKEPERAVEVLPSAPGTPPTVAGSEPLTTLIQ